MIKLLKSVFGIMWFVAKAAWFCIFFFIFYNLLRDQVEDYIKKYQKKKTSQDMAEEILSDENLNKDPHEKKESEDA